MENAKIVLSIDDDSLVLGVIKRMLTPKYDVRVVSAASEAMSYLNTDKADVILLDIEMPNISGFDFLYDIKKIPSYMSVPIIIVSGNTGHDFLEKARSSSAFDVLSKPVNKEQLVETIEKALSARK